MKKTIFFDVRPYQTRIAYTEEGGLKDLLYYRKQEPSLVGGIYKGKVARSPKGLNFVFIDLGFKRSGFLFKQKKSHRSEYKEGEVLLVQVVSDPIHEKGSRLTADISLSTRFLVYIPQQEKKITLSRRISDEKEKKRLSQIIEKLDETGTFIVRTSAEGQSEKEIKKDVTKLKKEWKELQKKFKQKKEVGEVEKGLSPDFNYLKDFLSEGVDEIFVNQQEAYLELKKFIKKSMPKFLSCLKLYLEKNSLFEAFDVESQVKEALSRRVRFKGGGFLIFEELEALTVIDVNTGRYMGKRSHKESILKTNLEAARALTKQIRLRHLGGIIIIDFIDMEDLEARKKVVSVLEEDLKSDKAYPRVFPMTDLGLVHITRKRIYPSLSSLNSTSCHLCKGSGRVRSKATIAGDIFTSLEEKAKKSSSKKRKIISISCHSEIKKYLEESRETLLFFKKELSLDLKFLSVSSFSLETFKIEALP